MRRFQLTEIIGAPREIRTPDLLVRSQLLYPAELWTPKRLGSGDYREVCGCQASPTVSISVIRERGNSPFGELEHEGNRLHGRDLGVEEVARGWRIEPWREGRFGGGLWLLR